MKRALSHLPPLVIEWSPREVRLFDASNGRISKGPSIALCVKPSDQGREAIVGISQRSAFVRCTAVPNVAKDEVQKVLDLNLHTLLPTDAAEYVTGFRLGSELRGRGRIAVVGAMKVDALRRIHEECRTCGISVRAVLPLAFAAWLAARAHTMPDCLVLSKSGSSLHAEVVSAAELRYSRSFPKPDLVSDVADEIARTFDVAETAPTAVLALGLGEFGSEVCADVADAKDPLEYLIDVHAIDRLLFSFELPEAAAALRNRARNVAARRAIAATAVAAVLGTVAYAVRAPALAKQESTRADKDKAIRRLRQGQSTVEVKLAQSRQSSEFLKQMFAPAQSFSDVLNVVANAAPKSAWFTGITLQRGHLMALSGDGTSGQDIAHYVSLLADKPRFKDMKLSYANKAMVGQKQVVRFSITGYALGMPDAASLTGKMTNR